MRTYFKLAAILICIVSIERFCYLQTGGFRIAKIAHTIDTENKEPPKEEIKGILKKPFYFLGSGVQSYAFVSQDGRYVLKLFKSYHGWIPTNLLEKIPLSIAQEMQQARAQRLHTIFTSCRIAYEKWKPQTALLYMHLHTADHFEDPIYIIDPLGIQHIIDPNTTAFALQKKAELVHPYLSSLEDKQKAIESLVSLIVKRSQAGICNHDPIIHRNFGFVEGQAVEIDIGSFSENAHMKKPYAWKRELFYTLMNSPELPAQDIAHHFLHEDN